MKTRIGMLSEGCEDGRHQIQNPGAIRDNSVKKVQCPRHPPPPPKQNKNKGMQARVREEGTLLGERIQKGGEERDTRQDRKMQGMLNRRRG